MNRQKTICFDLDGTLANYDDGWQGLENIGEPLARGKKILLDVYKYYRVIIFTCRNNPVLNPGRTKDELRKIIEDWFFKHNLPFDEIYMDVGKPIADAYVDDRAVHLDKYSNIDRVLYDIKRIAGD